MMSVIEQGRLKETLVFLLLHPFARPFRTLHCSVITWDLQHALLEVAGPTGTLLLLAASSLGSDGACILLLLCSEIPGYFALDFTLGSIVYKEMCSGQIRSLFPRATSLGAEFRISNAVRLYRVRGSGKEQSRRVHYIGSEVKVQRVMGLMVFTFDQCQNLEFIRLFALAQNLSLDPIWRSQRQMPDVVTVLFEWRLALETEPPNFTSWSFDMLTGSCYSKSIGNHVLDLSASGRRNRLEMAFAPSDRDRWSQSSDAVMSQSTLSR